MAKWDVHEIVSATYLANGWIDFIVRGELDDSGVITEIPYTWDPNEADPDTAWPMAFNVRLAFLSMPEEWEPEPYVWRPPEQVDLAYRLKRELKRIKLSDYVERYISTGGAEAVPDDVQSAASFARTAYNTFKDALPSVPQDWADDKYWQAS